VSDQLRGLRVTLWTSFCSEKQNIDVPEARVKAMAVAMRTRCKRQVDSRVTAGDEDVVMIPCRTAGRYSPAVLDANSMTIAYCCLLHASFRSSRANDCLTLSVTLLCDLQTTGTRSNWDRTAAHSFPTISLTFNVWLHYFLFRLL